LQLIVCCLRTLQFIERRIRGDVSAVSTIEFALLLPVFMVLGLTGVEIAYMATVDMQVSQTAISLADNASRLGQTDNSSVTPTVTEVDIDSLMSGALKQGEAYALEQHGRIILSSLEYHSATGQQYIHWQRCRGKLSRTSAYGDDGANNGLGIQDIAGVGTSSNQVEATERAAVMVAEVYYEYNGLIGGVFGKNANFRQEAVFLVRDDRNLSPGVTGTGGQSSCS
jgi:hypothetical protein